MHMRYELRTVAHPRVPANGDAASLGARVGASGSRDWASSLPMNHLHTHEAVNDWLLDIYSVAQSSMSPPLPYALLDRHLPCSNSLSLPTATVISLMAQRCCDDSIHDRGLSIPRIDSLSHNVVVFVTRQYARNRTLRNIRISAPLHLRSWFTLVHAIPDTLTAQPLLPGSPATLREHVAWWVE